MGAEVLRGCSRWRTETGQVLVIFALAMPVLLGLSALVIDVGNFFVQKRSLQRAADASALAAVQDTTQVENLSQTYSIANGGPTGLHECPLTAAELSGDGGCYTWPYNGDPGKVEVILTKTEPTLFGRIFGKSGFTIKVRAVGLKYYGTTTTAGIVTTIPGTVTTIGGTVTTLPGTVTTTPGTTTPATPGKAALLLAKSTACNVPLKIGGANSGFFGAVVSNGGVQVISNDIKGDEIVWGKGQAAGCIQTKPDDWKGIIREAPQIYDWFVPIPVCSPADACTPGTAVMATSVSDGTNSASCEPFSSFNSTTPVSGLYCSTSAITLPNRDLTAAGGFGFIAPSITFGGQVYRGYTGLYTDFGGLFLYAYAGDLNAAGAGSGFKGAIFAPLGDVSMAGSSSSAVCETGVGGCGFIEALTISLTGSKATWQGLGPGFGGTPATTTPGTTTTTPGTTTIVGGTVTTTPGTVSTGPDVTSTTETRSNLDE